VLISQILLQHSKFRAPNPQAQSFLSSNEPKLFSFSLRTQFFATTGRDELQLGDDHLYDEGIDIDRAGGRAKAQDIAMQHRTLFVPNYQETRIDVSLPLKKLRNFIKHTKNVE